MPGYTFSREATKLLIELYEQEPFLYNVKSSLYKNKAIRVKKLENLAEQISKFVKEPVQVEDVQKKIKNLRTQYFNEVNKIKNSESPSWWAFELLQFLNNSIPCTEEYSNFVSTNCNIKREEEFMNYESNDQFDQVELDIFKEDQNFDDSIITPSTSMSSCGCKKRKTYKNEELGKSDRLTKGETSNPGPDHIEAFGTHMVAELRRIKNRKVVDSIKRECFNRIYEELERQEDSD